MWAAGRFGTLENHSRPHRRLQVAISCTRRPLSGSPAVRSALSGPQPTGESRVTRSFLLRRSEWLHGRAVCETWCRLQYDKRSRPGRPCWWVKQVISLEPGGLALAAALKRFTMPAFLMGILHDGGTCVRLSLEGQNAVIGPGGGGSFARETRNHSKTCGASPRACRLRQTPFTGWLRLLGFLALGSTGTRLAVRSRPG